MSICDQLVSLARGEPLEGALLLPSVRAEGWGGGAFAPEAVTAMFRARPSQCSEWQQLADERGAAVVGDREAVIADLVDGRCLRIWRLGSGEPVAGDRAISLSFDPDLRQQRGDVIGSEEWGEDRDLVSLAGAAIHRASTAFRLRLFPIRIIGGQSSRLVLFAAYVMDGEVQRHSGFVMMVAVVEGDNVRVLRDLSGEDALMKRDHPPRI